MLVMYTLNGSIASKLPQTSVIKFIDIWIVYGLFIHFLILVLLITIEHQEEMEEIIYMDGSKSGTSKVSQLKSRGITKVFAQKVLPLIQIIFVLVYALCAMILYN